MLWRISFELSVKWRSSTTTATLFCLYVGDGPRSVARLACPTRPLLRQGTMAGLHSPHPGRHPWLIEHAPAYLPANQPSRDTSHQPLATVPMYTAHVVTFSEQFLIMFLSLISDWTLAMHVIDSIRSHCSGQVQIDWSWPLNCVSSRALPKHRLVNAQYNGWCLLRPNERSPQGDTELCRSLFVVFHYRCPLSDLITSTETIEDDKWCLAKFLNCIISTCRCVCFDFNKDARIRILRVQSRHYNDFEKQQKINTRSVFINSE